MDISFLQMKDLLYECPDLTEAFVAGDVVEVKVSNEVKLRMCGEGHLSFVYDLYGGIVMKKEDELDHKAQHHRKNIVLPSTTSLCHQCHLWP